MTDMNEIESMLKELDRLQGVKTEKKRKLVVTYEPDKEKEACVSVADGKALEVAEDSSALVAAAVQLIAENGNYDCVTANEMTEELYDLISAYLLTKFFSLKK